MKHPFLQAAAELLLCEYSSGGAFFAPKTQVFSHSQLTKKWNGFYFILFFLSEVLALFCWPESNLGNYILCL